MSALRELRRLLRRQSAADTTSGGETGDEETSGPGKACLPLLQVWPSQDSPRGEADGQSFVFPPDDTLTLAQADSGIDSQQASPSPCLGEAAKACPSLLHPDHARVLAPQPRTAPRRPSTPNSQTTEPPPDSPGGAGIAPVSSAGSSTASSLASVAWQLSPRSGSDPWQDRRRSSARYSLLDALDLEYALLRAAARGSLGPYSLSGTGSVHKLTFTQSLAFPALARNLAVKRRPSRIVQPTETGDSNGLAKLLATVILVLVSVMVFGLVLKYVRT